MFGKYRYSLFIRLTAILMGAVISFTSVDVTAFAPVTAHAEELTEELPEEVVIDEGAQEIVLEDIAADSEKIELNAGGNTAVMQAVESMTWGANLPDLYAIAWERANGNDIGYYDFAPFHITVRYWDGTFDEVLHDGSKKGRTVELMSDIPNYSAQVNEYIPLLELGIVCPVPNQNVKFNLADCRIELAGGTTVPLSGMNGDHDLRASSTDYGDGWFFIRLQPDDAAKKSEYNGAKFKASFTLIDSPFEQPKPYYFTQYMRTKYDQRRMIDIYSKQGMNVFRLNTSWTPFVNDETYSIDREWLETIRSEVDYITKEKGAYCILNMNQDYTDDTSYVNGSWNDRWMEDVYKAEVDARFASMWSQIADYFRNYDNKLIFEPYNEPYMPPKGETWEEKQDDYIFQATRINGMNKLFVDTIRNAKASDGGANYNKTRFLMLPVACYSTHPYLQYFEAPQNDENIMTEIHPYDAMELKDFNDMEADSDVDGYKGRIDAVFAEVDKFKARYPKIPVVVAETGVSHIKGDAAYVDAVSYFYQTAKNKSVPAFWWEDFFPIRDSDGNSRKRNCYWLYDKEKDQWGRPQILDAIIDTLGLTSSVVKEYTVTYDLNGHGTGLAPASVTVYNRGTRLITEPAAPTDAERTFGGWYTSPSCSIDTKWYFDKSRVDGNITLYAKWTQGEYSVFGDAAVKDADSLTHAEFMKMLDTAVMLADESKLDAWRGRCATDCPAAHTSDRKIIRAEAMLAMLYASFALGSDYSQFNNLDWGTTDADMGAKMWDDFVWSELYKEFPNNSKKFSEYDQSGCFTSISTVGDWSVNGLAYRYGFARMTVDGRSIFDYDSVNKTMHPMDPLTKTDAVKALSRFIDSVGTSPNNNPSGRPVTNVSLDISGISLYEGKSAKLTASVTPDDASWRALIWSSSDENVAAVRFDGTVDAIADGSADITVRPVYGDVSAVCHVTVKSTSVTNVVEVASVSLDRTSLSLKIGETYRLTATVHPQDATNSSVRWGSESGDIADVDAGGLLTAKKAGRARIFVETNDGHKKAYCEVTVTEDISPGGEPGPGGNEPVPSEDTVSPVDIEDDYYKYARDERLVLSSIGANIVNTIKPKVYDGNAYMPAVKVKATVDGKTVTLTEGADYRVIYEHNINAYDEKKPGRIIVKGNGRYTGEITAAIRINPRPLGKVNIAAGSMSLDSGSEPDIPVYLYDGGKQLTRGTDFTLSPDTGLSKTAGKKAVTVTGIGNYSGTKMVNVTVYDSDKVITDAKLQYDEAGYTGKALKPTVEVKAGSTVLDKKFYTVKYANNKNAGTAFVTVTGKKGYVGSLVMPFVIKPVKKSFELKKAIQYKTYNGKLQKPKVTVICDGKALKAGRDYYVLYENNLHAGGKARITVTGIGNYADTPKKTFSFVIKPQKISKAAVKGTKETLALTYANIRLLEGTDYEKPVFGDEIKGKIPVTIQGRGDFAGSEVTKKVKVK